jgi:hypothetical protein
MSCPQSEYIHAIQHLACGCYRADSHLASRRSIRAAGSTTAILVFFWLFGCTPNDPGNNANNPYAGQWVFTGLRSAMLSVSGRSPNEIYAVGADLGEGDGPNFLAFNGRNWRRIHTGVSSGDLWWISVTTIDGAFYLAGDPGLVLRFDPASNSFIRLDTPGTPTLFGIWGTSRDNLWAVGGELSEPDTSGVIWRHDGESWISEDLTGLFPGGAPLLYKVWGRDESEVYVVGTGCTALQFDGSSWRRFACDAQSSLVTVHGNASLVSAAGGMTEGVLAELIDGAFTNRVAPGTPRMSGLFVPEVGTPVAVGSRASLAARTESGWALRDTGLSGNLDLHAVWIDSDGGAWAVGGDLGSQLDEGIVAYFGDRTISRQIARD